MAAVETEAELLAQLTTLQAAITATINGTRLSQLIVGSGDFQRRYTYTECTLESLKAERDAVQTKLSLLATAAEPTYRESAPLGVSWSKL